MPFYIRKSIKVAPGVRVNVSKSGLGVSVGPKGFKVSTGPRGTQINAGRDGIYYRKTLSAPRTRPGAQRRPTAPPVAPSLAGWQLAIAALVIVVVLMVVLGGL